MRVVIVESPTKAKTISRFLGSGFLVESSYGHVRDLPRGSLGVDEKKNFEPHYVIPRKSQKTVNNLKKVVAKADEVILATDEDREGEAIAWHLTQALDLHAGKKIKRIVFHEITQSAIEAALKKPRSVNKDLVDAQQARRVIDRLVGYKLSPFLWQKIRGGLSAGRVQSVALRLIADREKEIKDFKPQEYWTIETRLQTAEQKKLEAALVKIGDRELGRLDIKTAREAQLLANDIKKSPAAGVKVTQKAVARKPLPPFTTSTLQQEASRRLRFSAKQTMFFAQKLYENGHITYMRTDSVSLSRQSMVVTQKWLADKLGAAYAVGPRSFRGKSKLAQEAHEAIRPTDPFVTPADIRVTKEEGRLYELIWQRFVASQMPDAKFESTAADIKVSGTKEQYLLRANGNVMKFDGFLKIWPSKLEDRQLPPLSKGEKLQVLEAVPGQHFTEPPPRYNEATLIKVLEEYGIGRPSTYAPIISVIQDRGYVSKDENRRFYPEEIGELVHKLLVQHFPQIIDIGFTASIEEEFDEVANGLENWRSVVRAFYEPFAENLEKKYAEVKKTKIEVVRTDVKCEKCGRQMIEKSGRFGKFLACPGYPDCKNTKTAKEPPKSIGVKCPGCGRGDIVVRKTKRGRLFYGCNRYPECEFASWKKPEIK